MTWNEREDRILWSDINIIFNPKIKVRNLLVFSLHIFTFWDPHAEVRTCDSYCHAPPQMSLYATKWRYGHLDILIEPLYAITCRTPSKRKKHHYQIEMWNDNSIEMIRFHSCFTNRVYLTLNSRFFQGTKYKLKSNNLTLLA